MRYGSWRLYDFSHMVIQIGVSGGEVRWVPIPTLSLAEKLALGRIARCLKRKERM